MTQRREAMAKGFERLECLADLPLVTSPAHQREHQPALAFAYHAPACSLNRGKPRARLQLPAITGYQARAPFVPAAAAAIVSAAERSFLKEYRSDRTACVGA